MLAQWDEESPGRVESIFASIGNVAPSHLADTSLYDFQHLSANIPQVGQSESDESDRIDIVGI